MTSVFGNTPAGLTVWDGARGDVLRSVSPSRHTVMSDCSQASQSFPVLLGIYGTSGKSHNIQAFTGKIALVIESLKLPGAYRYPKRGKYASSYFF